jgi:16S rRNA (cytidine1402-2'-O)-methyltransferase
MAGTLYIVATPIGNLADITLRAIETLKAVDLIAAEDTRVTRNLLSHYGIDTPMTPYHEHSLDRKLQEIVEKLKAGGDVAIVSDAGTPGISDPGHELIVKAIENGISVTAIPGPSAVITALVVSGLPTYRFSFDGFPPRKPSDRRAFFTSLQNDTRTMVFYESPVRLLSTLKDMLSTLGNRRICVLREATKLFEEIYRGTVESAIRRFTEVHAKGEITIVLEGSLIAGEGPSAEDLDSTLLSLLNSGLSERDAVREASSILSVPKKEAYRRMLELVKNGGDG